MYHWKQGGHLRNLDFTTLVLPHSCHIEDTQKYNIFINFREVLWWYSDNILLLKGLNSSSSLSVFHVFVFVQIYILTSKNK